MAKFISLHDTRDVYRRVSDASFIEISDITHQFHTWDVRVAIGRMKTQSAKRVQFQITYKYLVNTREILFHP